MKFTLMGIVNVTPDSFSDGGRYLEPSAAISHAHELAAEGAAIIDVGGESTRPGASEVPEDEELRRIIPVVRGLNSSALDAIISVDTTKARVARAAIEAGARYINDVSGMRFDPEMAAVVADTGVDCCLMHMQGVPSTMQQEPRYDDVIDEVRAFLEERIAYVVGEGVREERIMVDPGIGFGKTVAHNLELIARLGELCSLGRPIVVGTSRKSFLTKLGAEDRSAATIATNVLALERGASVFRVHDVAPVRDALMVASATVS